MGVTTSARQGSASGKYFWINRLMVWQQEVMTIRFSPFFRISSYCFLTIVAPTAVSSAPAKPSFRSAARIVPIDAPSKLAMKDGARLAMTFGAVPISTFAFSTPSAICLAFCGQTTKHWPHSTHSSGMICA